MQHWWSKIRSHLFANAALELALVLLPSALFLVEPAEAAPKTWQLDYVIHRKDMPTANQTEIYSQENGRYQVDVSIKGIGIYALLGERRMQSRGLIGEHGLQPQHFEVHQGKNTSKSLYADFDWENNALKLLVKDVSKTVPLESLTQDLASLAYQWRYWLKTPPTTISVTTGKQRKNYQLQIYSKPQTLQLPAGKYKVVRVLVSPVDSAVEAATPAKETESSGQTTEDNEENVVSANPGSTGNVESVLPHQDQKMYWLAVDHQFLPVRILMHDESGALIEQSLSSLREQ